MRTLLVHLVVSLAAILPSTTVLAAPSLDEEEIGVVTGPVRGPRPSRLEKRRVIIDAEQMVFNGGYGWWLRDNLAAMLRNQARSTGLVEIAVSGQDFGYVAGVQDQIWESGRYSEASRVQVPRGEMIAPTDVYKLTAFADVKHESRGGNLSLGGHSLYASGSQARAVVRLVLEPIDIASGLSANGYEATAEAKQSLYSNLSGWTGGRSFSQYGSSSNVEQDLLQKAASRAVDKIIAQLDPEPLEYAPAAGNGSSANSQSTVRPPAPKPVWRKLVTEYGHRIPLLTTRDLRPGESIVFFRPDGTMAHYKIHSGPGRYGEYRVATITEYFVPTREPFRIFR